MLPHDVTEALAAEGFPVRRSECISVLRSPAEPRFAALVELQGGGRIKVRRVRDERRAAEVFSLCRGLPVPELARIHLRSGAILVEEWIEGTPLQSLPADEACERAAAAWLGRLHSISSVNGVRVRSRQKTDPWREKAFRDLQQLVAGGVLDTGIGAGLQRGLAALDPGTTEIGATHLDLCPENLVLDSGGALRVVDNEWLCLGPLELDLATSWHRWPMPASHWERFVDAYSAARQTGTTTDRMAFWRIVTLSKSAAYRHRLRLPGGEEALAKLTVLARTGCDRSQPTRPVVATARGRRPARAMSP